MPDPVTPFGLLNTKHGPLIVNRNDYRLFDNGSKGYGVGFQLMNKGEYDPEELAVSLKLINARLQQYGPGVVVVDCGANIGVFTVEWAKALGDLGHVYSFEAQEKLFYALAGNVILHNCFNVTARHAAVGATNGVLDIPEPDYTKPSSFGSFELRKRVANEDIGQAIDYDHPTLQIPMIALDSLNLQRLDLLKVDVEGMEMEVLEGAVETIKRCQPQVFIETLKSHLDSISKLLAPLGYARHYGFGLNTLFIHDSDPLVVTMETADVH
jgi:FkbM family methyltransferase